MAGKKRSRSRRSISSDATATPLPPQSVPPHKYSSSKAVADSTNDHASIEHDDSVANKLHRKKMKNQKKAEPNTETVGPSMVANDAEIKSKHLDDDERTPKSKRRKLVKSKERLPNHHGEQTATKKQQQQDPVEVAVGKFTQSEIVHHISIFLSGSKSPLAAPTSLAFAAEISAEKDDHDGSEIVLGDKDVGFSSSSRGGQSKGEQLSSISYLVRCLECREFSDSTTESTENIPIVAADAIVTQADIATLLLPWSVACLMRLAAAASASFSSSNTESNNDNDNDEQLLLAWKVLSCCLDILSLPNEYGGGATSNDGATGGELRRFTTSTETAALLSTSLSQSTLNRLVPYSARISFASFRTPMDVSSKQVSTTPSASNDPSYHASNCFLHLTRHYRPSLDNACNSLLREVDSLVFSSLFESAGLSNIISTDTILNIPQDILKLPSHQSNVVCATLRLIHTLMPNANPKRLFGTICSMEVLPSLGRLMKVVNIDREIPLGKESNDANSMIASKEKTCRSDPYLSSAKEIVQDIVWGGLLHPIHHMDGFRTMSELQSTPVLPTSHGDGITENPLLKDASVENESGKGKGSGAGVKSCFQSSLFASLQSLLLPRIINTNGGGDCISEGGEDARNTAIRDAMATANILPIITHGFFKRIRAYAVLRTAGSGDGGGGGLTSETAAKLQFRFWCRVMRPALEQLFRISHPSPSVFVSRAQHTRESDRLTLALLEATLETLGLLLKYDAYLPSYSDPNQHHLKFLECVTEDLLQCIDNFGSEGNESLLDQKIRKSLVTSLHNIILLNHRLLHEKLPSVISFACSCLCTTALDHNQSQMLTQAADELLSVIARTYRELRQVGYFLISTRGAFAVGHHASQGSVEVEFMKYILNCANIIETLSLAYQSCPSGQLHEIWNFFNGWIVNIVDSKFVIHQANENDMPSNNIADATKVELLFAAQMFIIFIKNIRANKQNSSELRSLCEMSATTSISKLLGKTCGKSPNISLDCRDNRGILMRHGFDLCGWLVDLHARSCFWIDNIDVDDGKLGSTFLLSHDNVDADGLNVIEYLRNVAKATVSTERFKMWRVLWLETYWQSSAIGGNCLEKFCDIGIPPPVRGSLQRLAFHRIHQLHSMIYFCNLRENESQPSDIRGNHSSSQELMKEAKMLVDLSIYIACSQLSMQYKTSCDTTDESSSESLWSPVAQSLSIWTQYSDSFQIEIFFIWFFTALCQNQRFCSGVSAQVFRIDSLALARDASFYSGGMVMQLFMKVGIQFAGRFFDSIEINGIPSVKVGQESYNLTTRLAGKDDVKLSHENLIDSLSTQLSFLVSAPLELAFCNENLNLLGRMISLVVPASQVTKRALDAHDQDGPKLLDVLRSSIGIITNLLPKTLIRSSDSYAPCLANMTSQLSKIAIDFRFDDGLSFACSDAINEYLSLCIDHHEKNASMLVELYTQMKSLACDIADDDFSPTALLIRSFIRRINILDRHGSFARTATLTRSCYELCMDFVLDVQKRIHSGVLRHLSKAGSRLENDKVAANALLVQSEIFSFIGNYPRTTPVTNLKRKVQVEESWVSVRAVFDIVTNENVQGSHFSSEFTNATTYFLAAMAATPGYTFQCVSPSKVLESILSMLARSFACGQESPLLDAALCSLIRNFGLPGTKIVITHVLLKPEGCNRVDSAFVTKVFHLLITCANSQDQHQFISGRCKTFLSISMGLLRDRECDMVQLAANIKLFSKTLTTLTSKKELLLLSGREIAMICCAMNPLLHHDVAQKCDANEGSSIFKSCCLVVASLISHYPKQLYGCPSSLFSLLLALLSHILQTDIKNGMSQKALEYAKVCELLIPHKDIFKKHVVGLILRYITALNDGMNPSTKSKIMPSVYALLDMCSDFETRQINAMIDVSSKTLFAPVFLSYRKYYQYSGQA